MEFTLPTGTVIRGTETEVRRIVTTLGYAYLLPPKAFVPDGVQYKSNTRGVIQIKDMDTRHLKNAIRKLYRQWAENLPVDNTAKMVQTLRTGMTNDLTMLGLVAELNKRRD